MRLFSLASLLRVLSETCDEQKGYLDSIEYFPDVRRNKSGHTMSADLLLQDAHTAKKKKNRMLAIVEVVATAQTDSPSI